MSLEIEYIAVIVKVSAYCEKFDWELNDLPDEDTDGLIYKDESMNPMDAADTIAELQKKGLKLYTNEKETEFADIAIVDMAAGLLARCSWLECERRNGRMVVNLKEYS